MGGKQRTSKLLSFVAAILGLLLIAVSSAGGAIAGAPSAIPAKEGGVPAGAAGAAQQQKGVIGPIISQAIKSDVSPPLSSLPIITEQEASSGTVREIPMFPVPQSDNGQGVVDNVVQSLLGPLGAMPTPIANFAGMPNYWGVLPPDTVGDVGPNHYVQIVNSTGVQVFSKTGTSLAGPVNLNSLFRGVGGPCETNNNGDPIVLHDQMADRWLLSQFGFNSQSGPTFQCIAISTSSDPTGSYYRYVFETATVGFDDYPKYGVWPDAYYMSANRFGGVGGNGAAVAFERQRMLEGDPTARMVVFLTSSGGHLPSDMDGGLLPPAGSPNYYLYPTSPSIGLINEYKFHVDWSNPALSTYTGPFSITVAPWDQDLCVASREQCIDQPGTTARLEAIADRFMHRLTYRNMGTHESLMVTHTVDGNGAGIAGKRWYEFRDPNGARTVFQEGTYAPADGTHRWMGSLAMDRQGNMALGFSASSTTLFPTIRYAGRLVTDPLGQMAQGEETLIAGGGSQTNTSAPRWGDYSSLNIDPRDDCTFWYTQEYYSITAQLSWKTRIGSFRFPGCTGATATPVPPATGTPPTATPTPMASSTPCAGSTVVVGSITNSDTTQNLAVVGGVNGQCGVTSPPCAMSGIPGRRHYDSYTFTNSTGDTQCVTVNIDGRACAEAGVNSVVYLTSFNPESVCANFLAKAEGGPNQTYSFSVPAGATYIVVVREVATDSGCNSYTLSVNPCYAGSVTPVPTSTSTTVVTPTMTGTLTATATNTTIPTATPTSCPIQFTDVPASNTFYTNIRCLACRGIVSGYSDGTFRPNNQVTRGQLAKMVSNSAGFSEPVTGQTFQDVPPTHTFYEFIERLTTRGHMTGYVCGGVGEPCLGRPYFRPQANATRGQTSKIVSNAAGFTEPPVGQTFEDVPPSQLTTFYEFIQRLASRGVMGGYECGGPFEPCVGPENKPYFRPGNDVTRGQSAKIVANAFFPGCDPAARP